MGFWLFRRVLQAALVVLAMSVIVFAGMHIIGSPVDVFLTDDSTQEDRQRLIEALGLDQPIWVQYLRFLGSALQGEMGNSFVYNVPAVTLILQRLPATLELAFAALFMAIVIGVPLGLWAGMRPNSTMGRLITTGSILGFSLPTFWVGLLLIMIFSVSMGILPASGRGETVEIFGVKWSFLTWDGLRHLMLPAINLALFKVSMVIRLTRSGVREVVSLDYVKFARAKGLMPSRIVFMHILRNTMIPLVTVLGLELGSTVAYAVVTESIFAWPGAGKLILDSLNALDRPVVVAYLLVVVVLFVSINLIVDILYRVLDPRVRIGGMAA
ncbi:ABC transporter permease [Nitratireductor aquimarinus]|uniref:ABC transporter permease n=1 Tax=Nitratireductor TaxID=245876 RepID=UPI0019D3AA57|nr:MULTISPECIES: ABC transporter permease [Nitratireductor]MBN7776604.1 ABC transporter permease [Nitratireductor pacificus]MBN7779471.1 ABC transporter permease [Nitratireductor pacificus]MBN7788278.1 ABC transporter permease [Nitratireductor aquimarinus]MBY6098325.1 ABC transporter permease [Nitratireductor aquimarinus]MCA1261009.1 ABC transporter permease [Nitratireductor aquimarinus]